MLVEVALPTVSIPRFAVVPYRLVEDAVVEKKLVVVASAAVRSLMMVRLPSIYALPVVVAPPLMVRPPACVPSPMVEDAVMSSPDVVADTPASGCVQASYEVRPLPVSVIGPDPITLKVEQATEPEQVTDVVATSATVLSPVEYRRLPAVSVVDVPSLLYRAASRSPWLDRVPVMSPQATPVIYVLVSISSVPSPFMVLTKPFVVRLESLGIDA